MLANNRSIPGAVVIPELAYPDVRAAADWLCKAFGFNLRLMIGNHRAQLNVGEGGSIVVVEGPVASAERAHAVMVRVENADAVFIAAKAHGATVLREPADYPYGERQCTVEDIGGHVWTFTQSIADVDPVSWGGTPGQL
jgi:uncharacterized glyoxalase superfamily protein PhnB